MDEIYYEIQAMVRDMYEKNEDALEEMIMEVRQIN